MEKKSCKTRKVEEKKKIRKAFIIFMLVFLATLFLLFHTQVAYAAGAIVVTTGPMPWERALSGLAHSMTGPVALALSLIMVVVGVGVLMFGGDLAGWARWVAFACLAAGTLGGAGTMVQTLGVTGTVI